MHATESTPAQSLVQAINKALDQARPEELFVGILKYWFLIFPTDCVLVTLTQDKWKERHEGNVQQLRFWFGEPRNFRSNHVDSMGYNLIVSVFDIPDKLRGIVRGVLPPNLFEEGIQKSMSENRTTGVQDIITWRKKGVPPNSTGTVWKKEK